MVIPLSLQEKISLEEQPSLQEKISLEEQPSRFKTSKSFFDPYRIIIKDGSVALTETVREQEHLGKKLTATANSLNTY